MLFTRCPDCQTNFRVTADALRVADGHVRCGRCNGVFNAYAGLREEPDTPASGDSGGSSIHANAESRAEALDRTDEYSALPEAAAEVSDPSGPEPWQDEPPEPANSPAAPSAAVGEPPLEAPPQESSAATLPPTPEPVHGDASTLEFDLPKDEWTSFFEQVEDDAQVETAVSDSRRDSEAHEVGPLSTGDTPEELPAQDEPEDRSDDPLEHMSVDQIMEGIALEGEPEEYADSGLDPSDAAAASASSTAQEIEVSTGQLAEARDPGKHERSPAVAVAHEAPITPEEVDATLSAERAIDPSLLALDGPDEHSSRGSLLRGRWRLGSSLLLVILTLQVVHHFRGALASQPIVGPLLRVAYTQVGAEVTPSWDLLQYEIMDWVATAEPNASGQGSLRITARIYNHGPQAQPYPSVRLELKDRWEEAVGSRVFEPDEYLDAEASPDQLMAPGTTVPARFEVVDPGQDAYGFELDVCVPLAPGGLRCASDRVFE
jgi:predicted Zn finger-like uncharacterized protein